MLLQLLLMNTLSAASDVFSFGVIMYELLTFRVPFEGLRKEQVGAPWEQYLSGKAHALSSCSSWVVQPPDRNVHGRPQQTHMGTTCVPNCE